MKKYYINEPIDFSFMVLGLAFTIFIMIFSFVYNADSVVKMVIIFVWYGMMVTLCVVWLIKNTEFIIIDEEKIVCTGLKGHKTEIKISEIKELCFSKTKVGSITASPNDCWKITDTKDESINIICYKTRNCVIDKIKEQMDEFSN